MDLLRRAKAGEPGCLDRVLERYQARVLARIRLMMGNEARATAESGDFLQGVFVAVLEGFERFELRDERSFLVWVSQIARNGIRSHVRRRRERLLESLIAPTGRKLPSQDGIATPSAEAMLGEQIARLAHALAELDDLQRQVVELRHFERLSFETIGARIGRSANATQLLHSRVLARLSVAMADS